MNILFLQPRRHLADLGVNLDWLRPAARFGVVSLSSLPRRLRSTSAVVNCIDTSPAARRVIESAARAGVPRVYLFDGIYDVANAYKNPAHRKRQVAQMDPLLYSHVACVDRWSYEAFAALGIRTHAWLPARAAPGERDEAPKDRRASFLVATALTPAFDSGERSRLETLLKRTIAALERVDASYRFRTGDADLLKYLSVPAELNDTRDPFSQCIRRYDCLITTPSTIATTAMLAGKPVATLDYRDGPMTQQTGWRIHRSTDIAGALASMLEPAADRMTFQAREVAHLTGRAPVEEFILDAAGLAPGPGPALSDEPRAGGRMSFEYLARWVYVNGLKRFRKGL